MSGAVVSHNQAMEIAVAAQVCLCSVKKRLRGEPIRGRSGERLEAVLVKLGITPLTESQ